MKPKFANSKVIGHRPRVGLALSSGGARGLAHVGVIQVLEEAGIPVDVVAGASMGAYVGSLWAAGYSGKELYGFAAEIARPRDLWRRLDLAILPVKGLFHGDGVRHRLERALHGMKFSELKQELHVVAANVDTLERHVFTSGDIAMAVHASFAIPGICVPVEIDGFRYVDGGVVDPLPVGVLKRAGCDVVIAVTVIPKFSEVALCKPAERRPQGLLHRGLRAVNRAVNVFAKGNVVDTLRASLYAAQIRLAHAAEARADAVISAIRHTDGWHDYHHYHAYIETGRIAAEKALPKIRELLSIPTKKGHSHETNPESCMVG